MLGLTAKEVPHVSESIDGVGRVKSVDRCSSTVGSAKEKPPRQQRQRSRHTPQRLARMGDAAWAAQLRPAGETADARLAAPAPVPARLTTLPAGTHELAPAPPARCLSSATGAPSLELAGGEERPLTQACGR